MWLARSTVFPQKSAKEAKKATQTRMGVLPLTIKGFVSKAYESIESFIWNADGSQPADVKTLHSPTTPSDRPLSSCGSTLGGESEDSRKSSLANILESNEKWSIEMKEKYSAGTKCDMTHKYMY
jgi:hypothetical protein